MPGRWYSPSEDADYFSQVKFQEGDLLEIAPKDWAGSDQDSVVISVTSATSNKSGSGFWNLGKFVTAKDPYFLLVDYWASKRIRRSWSLSLL